VSAVLVRSDRHLQPATPSHASCAEPELGSPFCRKKNEEIKAAKAAKAAERVRFTSHCRDTHGCSTRVV
jgi:hypothetical protein